MNKVTFWIASLFLCLIFSCSPKTVPTLNSTESLSESTTYRETLISPLRLNRGLTEIVLSDFTNDITKIKEVRLSSDLKTDFNISDGIITIDDRIHKLEPISFLRIESDSVSVDIPLIKSE